MARREASEEAVTGAEVAPVEPPAEATAPASAEVVEEQPAMGGSYIRREDGSLELVHRTSFEPAGQEEA